MSVHQLFAAPANFYIGLHDELELDMEINAAIANPFALMTAPEMIFAAIERSDRLARLKSTICRPLDKPRPEKPIVDVRAFDDEVEATEQPMDA